MVWKGLSRTKNESLGSKKWFFYSSLSFIFKSIDFAVDVSERLFIKFGVTGPQEIYI